MKNRKPYVHLLLLVIGISLFPFLFSCSMENEAILEPDGSGEISFHVVMQPFLVDYIKEMSDLAGEGTKGPNNSVFDLEKIEKDLEEKPGVVVRSLNTPNPRELNGRFTFKDVEAIFQSEKLLTRTGAVTYERSGGESKFALYITRENFPQIAGLFPEDSKPFIDMFGPQENDDITREEYLDMMEFAMGEEAPSAIRRGTITITVRVKGTIVSQKGGTRKGETVVFSIPLLDALLLHKPLEYAIVFK